MPTTHGMTGTRQYHIWCNIKGRCFNHNNPSFKYYGKRGITVCDRWLAFENFWADMGPTYEDTLTIERKDVNGNYCPENCCWIPPEEQARNKRNNHIVETPHGKVILAELACETGVDEYTLHCIVNRFENKYKSEYN